MFSDQQIVRGQVVGQLGMWGTIINGIQASALEHKGMTTAPWTSMTSEKFTLIFDSVCSLRRM